MRFELGFVGLKIEGRGEKYCWRKTVDECSVLDLLGKNESEIWRGRSDLGYQPKEFRLEAVGTIVNNFVNRGTPSCKGKLQITVVSQNARQTTVFWGGGTKGKGNQLGGERLFPI